MIIILSILILGSTLLTLRAEYRGERWQVYLFKPLTTVLSLSLAVAPPVVTAPPYQGWIVLGLVFSLAGDIFLMLPQDRFIAGLVSFLGAHLCYIAAFAGEGGFRLHLISLLPFLLYAALLVGYLWPHLGRLRGPVVVYAQAILLMGWQGVARWLELSSGPALLAALGAILFLISDSALAINRFARPFAQAQAVVLGTYFLAQWLIALSV